MPNRTEREALRGAEIQTIDLIFEVLTSQQWEKLLKAPLQHAAASGRTDLAQRLVRAGAEIGDAALHGAILRGHRNIVSDLLDNGAPFATKDTDGNTPLHFAAYQGETEMVQLLLLKGAGTDVLDNQMKTPLYLAAYHGHLATTLALLASGADTSLGFGDNNAQVVHAAAEKGHVEILRALVEHGADVDAVDGSQSIALHYAAGSNRIEAVDMLVEAGANIEAPNRGGYTPLHCASAGLSNAAVLSLLKHGATANAQGTLLETPLMFAALRAGTSGAAEVVNSLLRAGGDETMVDDEGTNAAGLMEAYVQGEHHSVEDFERVRELLANAPADRAWRRRGYLILCRAYPDKVQQGRAISGTHHAGTGQRNRSRAKLARARGVARDSEVDEMDGGSWTVVLAKVLELQEEDIFRTIVGYL